MLKVKGAAGSICYVLTLSRSDSAVPQAVLNATAPVSNTPCVFVARLHAERGISIIPPIHA